MPLYEYSCDTDGIFERLQPMDTIESWKVALCPVCHVECRRIISRIAHIKVVPHERLRYGSGSKGKFISHKETGGLDIFIPSGGAMEQEEVDYVAAGAIEKERARIKKRERRPIKERLQGFVDLAYRTKRGQRVKVLKETINYSRIKAGGQ